MDTTVQRWQQQETGFVPLLLDTARRCLYTNRCLGPWRSWERA